MSRQHTTPAKPIPTANRILIHGLAIVFSALIFNLAARALALPGICALGPVLGVSHFTSWLLSDRPMVPWRQWTAGAAGVFIGWPIIALVVDRMFP